MWCARDLKVKGGRSLVGVDEGERREHGLGDVASTAPRRRSTHGLSQMGSQRARVPRRSGLETAYRQVTRRGERRATKGAVNKTQRVGTPMAYATPPAAEYSARFLRGYATAATQREGGRFPAWGTRRVANRYDYYREGHRVNRHSPSIGRRSFGNRSQTTLL